MQFKRIIAAIDVNDDLAEKVLKAAQSLASRDGAALAAVCVWPPLSPATLGVGGEGGASAAVASRAAIEQHQQGRVDSLAALKALTAKVAPDAEAVMLDGDAADETSAYAETNGADLIVTGSHQRGFWGSLVHGSASREVIHDAPCAVFVVTRRCADKI